MIVVYNEATQYTFLKSQFVIFRCQKYVKKRYIERTKKFYLETLKKCARSLCFTLLKIRLTKIIFASTNVLEDF